MFSLFGSGLFKLNHVLRPITTAFPVVVSLKNFISAEVMPRQLPVFTNCAISIYRDDSYDHVFERGKPPLDCYCSRDLSV